MFVGMVFQPAFANDNNLSFSIAEQQPRGDTFMKTYGGLGYDSGSYVQQTTDGGFIITGETDGNIWLIKTDSSGNKTWDKTFEGTSGKCVQQTTDDGYIIMGEDRLIKANSDGNKTWDKILEGSCNYVRHTMDEGFIITGTKDEDVWLVKTDNVGTILWNNTYGGKDRELGYCVQQTTDGGYIITGEKWGDNIQFNDIWLIKTDRNGTKIWDKTYEIRTDWDQGRYVQQTSDGGYIITGKTQAFGLYSEVFLLKTDNAGNKIWSTTPGFGDFGYCVRQTTDGGYIVTGLYDTTWGNDVLLLKTTSSGNEQWERSFGGWKDKAVGYCVQQTPDEGYIITGITEAFGAGNGDVLLIKTDKDGQSKTKVKTELPDTPISTDIEFANPSKGYFHIYGIPLFITTSDFLANTVNIGGFRLRPIQVDCNGLENATLMVQLFINKEDKGFGTWNPETGFLEWQWTGLSFGFCRLEIWAEDMWGEVYRDEISVWNLCFLP
jgi:hypothetical protein